MYMHKFNLSQCLYVRVCRQAVHEAKLSLSLRLIFSIILDNLASFLTGIKQLTHFRCDPLQEILRANGILLLLVYFI